MNKCDFTDNQLLSRIVESMFMESKDHLIDRIPNLDDEKRERMKRFFRRNPSLEKRFDWNRPNDITWSVFSRLEDDYPEPIDPDTVPEFSDKKNEGGGINSYLVQDDVRGQRAVRRAIDTHWGRDANPWCLAKGDGYGGLHDDAWDYWCNYRAVPKRIAFKNGKLLAFRGSDDELDLSNAERDRILTKEYPPGTVGFEHNKKALIAAAQKNNEFDYDSDTVAVDYELADEDFYDYAWKHWPYTCGGYLIPRRNRPEEWWDREDAKHIGLDWAR